MITVLTPTYNRAYRLGRLYQSLVEQTSRNFEWMIIDDGSDDGTRELVEKWKDSPIKIRYLYKENGGKHTAVNLGIRQAAGDYVFIVDSDDSLLANAIETVEEWIGAIDGEQQFAGVAGLRGYTPEKAIGERPRSAYIDCTNLERKRYSLRGDKAEVYRTELLKKYPFPVFEGESYIPEDVVWNAIARDGYKLRWYNEIIYIGEYLQDGLTLGGRKEDKRLESFSGYTAREQLNVKVQTGLEKYMELGRYIDLVRKKEVSDQSMRWTKETLDISGREYLGGYFCYLIRKYGKIARGLVGGGQ